MPIPITPELIIAIADSVMKLKGLFGGSSEQEQRYMGLIRDLTLIGAEHIPLVIAALNANKPIEEIRILMAGMRRPVEPIEEDPGVPEEDD